MFDCCLKVKICKILSFIAQKGLLLLEPVAYGQKVTIKMTFPKSYDYKPSCKHVISTPGLSKFHMLCSKHIIFLLQDGQSKESSFLARKKEETRGINFGYSCHIGDLDPSSPLGTYISGGSLQRMLSPLKDKEV